jgi:hypothetical protein
MATTTRAFTIDIKGKPAKQQACSNIPVRAGAGDALK